MKIPHAILRRTPNNMTTLAVDMNCMIYHVLREPAMAAIPYPGEDGRLTWERQLIDQTCKYLTHVWREAGSPTQVYVGLDGVVPFAKIKQQRFRRFKSAAERAAAPSGAAGAAASWDTNAITPGTDFMRAMGDALYALGSSHNWRISTTDEPGEGEHKVLNWIRSTPLHKGGVAIYGLDADLILLSLLAGEHLGDGYTIYLMREAMDFGQLVRCSETGRAELCFFQIRELLKSIQQGSTWTREQLYDYIFGMSFCGNDFLPTGLVLRMRDKGHAILMSGLRDLWKTGLNLVEFKDSVAHPKEAGLKFFAGWVEAQEERLVQTMIQGKMSAPLGDNEADNLPLREQAEKSLIVETGSGPRLKRDWDILYARLALGSSDIQHRQNCVAEFWRGWCWVLQYYQGLPVDREWVYAQGYPPTWRDLRTLFQLPKDGWQEKPELLPQQQLALVLPLSSWGLVMKTPYRNLPALASQFWPETFGLESFGKRLGWECEPKIPMLTPERLRFEMK